MITYTTFDRVRQLHQEYICLLIQYYMLQVFSPFAILHKEKALTCTACTVNKSAECLWQNSSSSMLSSDMRTSSFACPNSTVDYEYLSSTAYRYLRLITRKFIASQRKKGHMCCRNLCEITCGDRGNYRRKSVFSPELENGSESNLWKSVISPKHKINVEGFDPKIGSLFRCYWVWSSQFQLGCS